MAGIVVAVDSATQTSELGSDDETYPMYEMGNSSPRVLVDTSQPFGSVEEAVIRFGGRGFWIPQPVLAVDASTATDDHCHKLEDSEIDKLYKDPAAAIMLRDLQRKEEETREILKELELTKRLVEELKLKVSKEAPECATIPCLDFVKQVTAPNKEFVNKYPVDYPTNQPTVKNEEQLNSLPSSATGLIMMELKQAKHNLYRNTNDLAELRASVEALSKKLESEKGSVQNAREMQPSVCTTVRQEKNTGGSIINPLAISRELRELNYEAEQFMQTAEAARSEVMKAMSDVEQTKTSLKVIEMRWVVAKKLEDAAKAAESLALAEIRALSSNESLAFEGYNNNQQKQDRVSLSIEEYSALKDKALKADQKMDGFRKISSSFGNSFPTRPRRDSRLLDSNEFEFARNEGNKPIARPTTSIGDILSRKLVLRDDLEVGRQEEVGGGGRQRVSLNQMLRRHRGETSPPKRREKDGNEGKHFFSKRKGLGFVHISLPMSKHNKSKIHGLNLWRREEE